jgi:hypothetical protein
MTTMPHWRLTVPARLRAQLAPVGRLGGVPPVPGRKEQPVSTWRSGPALAVRLAETQTEGER